MASNPAATESIPLAKPMVGERELELVSEVLESGVIALGPMATRFEEAFADYLGVDHAVAVSSGTAALHLSLLASGVGPGDEVITSPFSFVASANAILFTGAKPVFVDIDPESWNIDPTAVEAAVTPATKAILPVHIFGYPAAMPEIEVVAQAHNLAIVEDACEALGAVHGDGLKVGGRGHLACFGFYPNKQIATGEGGMVVTSDSNTAALIRSLSNQGRSEDMSLVEHVRVGYNYRLDDLSAALGVAQMEQLDQLLSMRAAAAGRYIDGLKGLEAVTLPCADRAGDRRSWFVFPILFDAAAVRERVESELRAAGIACKQYMPSIHLMSFYRGLFGYGEGDYPVSESVSDRLLALPFFPQITEDEVARVCDLLCKALDSA